MLSVLALLGTAALGATVLYAIYRFDDPAVPVVFDLVPPGAEPPYTLLQIWAHPDDETSMGGTTSKYGRHPQVRVVACYFTRGENGKPGVPPLCTQEELGEVRRGEMVRAAEAAGMAAHEVADFGDGALANRELEELEAQAVGWIRTYKPAAIFTWDPSGATGHPDHLRTHAVVRRAFHSAADPDQFAEIGDAPHQALRLYETVVPARLAERFRASAFLGNTWAMDRRSAPTHALGVRGYVAERIAIVKAHRTQHMSLRPFSQWVGPFVYWCWGKEYFTLALSAAPPANR